MKVELQKQKQRRKNGVAKTEGGWENGSNVPKIALQKWMRCCKNESNVAKMEQR